MTQSVGAGEDLVVFTPLPQIRVGGDAPPLLTGLAGWRRCLVVIEDGVGEVKAPEGVQVIPYRTYRRRQEAFAGKTHLYHLGNSIDCLYMLPAIVACPGVVVLPSPFLHNLLDAATAARGNIDDYTAAIAADYGGPGRILAQQFQTDRLREAAMMEDMPMLTGLLGPARAVIVHSQYAAVKVLASVPDAAVSIIPAFYRPPPDRPNRSVKLHDRFGVGANDLLLASLGIVNSTNRIDRVLTALAAASSELPPFRYVIGGELAPDGPNIREMANRLGLGPRVITTGHLPEPLGHALIAAADILIHLRPPIDGESSATLIDALGGGACSLVLDQGPAVELPAESVEKIPCGEGFDQRLTAAILRLARAPEARQRMGAAAARLIATQHAPSALISQYQRAIIASEQAKARMWRTPARWAFAPKAAPRPRTGRLYKRCAALPLPSGDLCAIRFAKNAISDGWAWQTRPLADLVGDGGAVAREADLILVDAEATGLVLHTVAKLRRLNQMLRFGGLLIVNLSRAEDGPRGLLESHTEGAKLLEASGFALHDHATAAEPDVQEPADPDLVEEHCWRATKVSEFFTRVNWCWDA
jgi:glycosyltransferase involved in cell wall biosynthesis